VTDTVSSWLDIGDTISTWAELAGIVEKYRANTWIFRGVDDARHDLVPNIGRPGARKDMNTGEDLPFDQAEELKLLSRYKRELNPHIRTTPAAHPSFDWELHAVAQHHGLSTRLLDWSESPLIAAYFAVERSGLIGGEKIDAALYGVPCPHTITVETTKWPAEHDVVALYPPHLVPRITVQRGLFTIHKNPNVPWKSQALQKWVIPSGSCLALKLALNRAGINRASLFPDPDGIAEHINWLHKWGIQ